VTTAKFAALPHAKAIQTAAQTFTGVIVPVQLDSEPFGTGVTFDDPNDQFVITTAGTYMVTGEVVWTQNGTGDRLMTIVTNSGEIAADARNATPSVTTVNFASTVIELNATDTVHLEAGQSSGGNLATDPSFGRGAALTVTWLGPKAP
jgi:hypothetical protein